jgi:hypothetical protein
MPPAIRWSIVSEFFQIANPEARSRQLQYLPGLGALHKILQGAIHRGGICSLAAQPGSLF